VTTPELEPQTLLVRELRDQLDVSAVKQQHLEAALRSSRDIGMAMGILMQRYQLTAEQAFARLTALSQHRNIKLRSLAEMIIYTGDTADVQ